jgi:hypothetical protein
MISPVKQIFDFHLTEDERTSAVWKSLKDRLEKKLAELRVKNDNPNLTDVETATLRGHIECLKGVISLGREPPPQVATAARPAPRTDLGAKYG